MLTCFDGNHFPVDEIQSVLFSLVQKAVTRYMVTCNLVYPLNILL